MSNVDIDNIIKSLQDELQTEFENDKYYLIDNEIIENLDIIKETLNILNSITSDAYFYILRNINKDFITSADVKKNLLGYFRVFTDLEFATIQIKTMNGTFIKKVAINYFASSKYEESVRLCHFKKAIIDFSICPNETILDFALNIINYSKIKEGCVCEHKHDITTSTFKDIYYAAELYKKFY